MHFVRDIRFARDIFAMQKRYVPLERKGICDALNKTGYALREGTETLPYIFLITNRFVGCGALDAPHYLIRCEATHCLL